MAVKLLPGAILASAGGAGLREAVLEALPSAEEPQASVAAVVPVLPLEAAGAWALAAAAVRKAAEAARTVAGDSLAASAGTQGAWPGDSPDSLACLGASC